MNPADNIEQAINNLYISTKAETDKSILDDAYTALEKSARGRSSDTGNVRRNIFINKIVKFAAVAAVILAVFAVFLSRPAATRAPGQIDAALKKAGNICITKFHAGDTEPYEQQWLSTSLHVKLLRTMENERVQFSLLDMPNKTKMQTFLASNSIRAEQLTDQMLAELEESMIQNAGLVRYFHKGEIPPNAGWSRVDDPQVTAQYPGTKIYELLWRQEKNLAGEAIFQKWRIFADAETNLPQRAEWYSRSLSDEQYGLESYAVFSYPRQEDVQALIRAAFGRAGRQPDGAEYIPTPGLQ
jgi:hypothetical protein